MESLRDICATYNVTVYDALDLYYTFGYDKLPEEEKAMSALRKCYAKAQLPYVMMEANGESEKVLVSSAQELLHATSGPKAYYLTYSLSQFVTVGGFVTGEKHDKSILQMTCTLAYHLLESGETFQTILLMTVGMLEELCPDLGLEDFLRYYALVVNKKGTDTLDFLRQVAEDDQTDIGEKVKDKMAHSVHYEKKQEKIETAKTAGTIGVKVGWTILARKITLLLAPFAGIGTAIVAGIGGVDLLMVIIALVCHWSVTWFFAALGAIGALVVIYDWWIGGLAHPVRFIAGAIVGSIGTIISLIMFIANVIAAIITSLG